MSTRNTLQRVLAAASDANIGFDQLRKLMAALGFQQRIRGDHHIFYREDIEEIINLQPMGS
ncbi:MAG: type II toxin-antitoxin system HicA family toxin, partial [Acidobacteria bacterium]|nr:type II toxin-antitoxin system HicA family toxin [Acidobacteriota bacterium]